MNLFDKICAVPTILLGVIFMALGAFGLVAGSNAHFTLPPVLGCLPFFFGWAMCVVLVKFWMLSNKLALERRSEAFRPSVPQDTYGER